jgi:F0F1-type ATP synthase membrane subunit a
MVAGHILIKIIISNISIWLSILLLPILFLEILVAFLQAYIYLVLILSYYQDIYIPH